MKWVNNMDVNVTIKSNVQLTTDIYKMELEGNISAAPGQFVQVQVPGFYLRRPISVHEVNEDGISIIYKVVGDGTDIMSKMKQGETLQVFGPLGTGFPIEDVGHVVLVGGGVGIPPLYETAKHYMKNNTAVDVVLGFNDASQLFLTKEFEALGCHVCIATMDGSVGSQGTVMNAIEDNNIDVDFVESCGPLPMLKAIQNTYSNGYISLEARMACGIGACMGCVVEAAQGPSKRVCKDGPVFKIGEVVL